MRLMVSQNAPFIPMADSFAADSRDFLVADDDTARSQVGEVDAKVLTNRRPPWGIPGGLYDALKATGGSVLTATNAEAADAGERFLQTEGIDIDVAAKVAVASLYKAAASGIVKKNETVMLNITGGGALRFQAAHKLHHLGSSVVLPLNAPDGDILRSSAALF